MNSYNIIVKNEQCKDEVFVIVQAENKEDAEIKAEYHKALMVILNATFIRVEIAS